MARKLAQHQPSLHGIATPFIKFRRRRDCINTSQHIWNVPVNAKGNLDRTELKAEHKSI